tara:strand:+ start:230 stop:829 length:600 start_codon:yes stop_codon:yes gene_type:complete
MIAILDYGAGNTHSIQHACKFLGFKSILTDSPSDIKKASKIIVPGQGAYKQAMTMLHKKQLIKPLCDSITSGKPFFGICLGFQLLFESSTEHDGCEGLGIIPGHVTKIKSDTLTIPHMGWNSCHVKNSTMFSKIENESYFYFVHSFCVYKTDHSMIASTTSYDTDFVSSICKDNVWAAQFHPEKSSKNGLQLLNNFLEL